MPRPPISLLICTALALSGCSQGSESPLQWTEVGESAGLTFRHNMGAEKPLNLTMTVMGGCAFLDFDRDGWLDLFLVNGTRLGDSPEAPASERTLHALYRNRGDGTFEDVTEVAGFVADTHGQGCAVGDYDGDGFPDIYLTNIGPNQLFRNRGDGTFEDVTEKSGTADDRWGSGAVFFDLDGDNDLDLYVVNYLQLPEDQPRWGDRTGEGPLFYEPEDDLLYRNEGDGTFTNITAEVGLLPGGSGLTVVAADLDADGDQDLFVANDRRPNWLYENRGGSLVEVAVRAGVATDADGIATAGMGVDIIDQDGDGWQDIHLTNFRQELNNLYRNRGGLTFRDELKALGLDAGNRNRTAWATRFIDFDHDGLLDCFVANGGIWDLPGSRSAPFSDKNLLFHGQPDGSFVEVGELCWELPVRLRSSRGAAFGDYDKDGDIDFVVLNLGDRAQLFRNDAPPNKRWMQIRVEGRAPNTDALGAKVLARLPDRTVMREVRYAGTYLSSSDPTIHIGLRPGETAAEVDVTWPTGSTLTLEVKAGTSVVVQEPGP